MKSPIVLIRPCSRPSTRLARFVIGGASRLSCASPPSIMLSDHWFDYRLFLGSDEHSLLPDEGASPNPLRQDDWLLPAMIEPMTEVDMYEKLLTKSNSSCMWTVAFEGEREAAADRPVNNVQTHKDTHTISPSQMLPSACEEQDASEHLGRHGDVERKPAKNTVCEHCGTTQTPLWRRVQGRTTCNACALYEKLHGKPRPVHLLNHTIRRRNRQGHSRGISKDADKTCAASARWR